MLAQSCSVHWCDEGHVVHGARAMIRPMVLESGNANCIFAATQAAGPELSVAGIEELSGRVPLGMLWESPDAAAPNIRKQAYNPGIVL